ncbi:unnamed protein product, partial [Vitis vinifera]
MDWSRYNLFPVELKRSSNERRGCCRKISLAVKNDWNSDNYVVVEMGLTLSFQQLLSILHCNSLMDRMLDELHS